MKKVKLGRDLVAGVEYAGKYLAGHAQEIAGDCFAANGLEIRIRLKRPLHKHLIAIEVRHMYKAGGDVPLEAVEYSVND